MSENIWSISQLMSSIFSPSSLPVSSEAGRWGSGSVGMKNVVRLAITSASLSGFLWNFELIIAIVFSL